MNLKYVLILFFFLAVKQNSIAQTTHPQKPNIIFILADDLGYGDVSCYNPQSKISTPNIDKLASEGMLFTHAHAASSVCTPSRYALLTGRNPYRSALKNGGVLWSYDWPLIEKNTETVADLLKNNGYQTALFGKWHLGWQWPLRENETVDTTKFGGRDQKASLEREEKIDLAKPFGGGPLACGFDHYFGVDIPSLPPFAFIENNTIYGPVPTKLKPDNMSGLKGLMQDGWTSEHMLPVIMDKALEYIDTAAKPGGNPFFLLLTLPAPHTPIAPSPEFKGKSAAGDYGDFVYEIDSYVGKLVAAVEASGTADNTLIIFTSDNGPINAAGDLFAGNPKMADYGSLQQYFNHSSSAGLRGMKGDAWQGGHSVPFIAGWPGVIPAGETNDQVVTLTDFFKTCAGILNVPVADSIAKDSYNIFPLLQSKKIKRYNDRYIITQSSLGCLSIISKEWKYIACNNSGGNLKDHYKADTLSYATPGQLYNLKKDPQEKNNLYNAKPAIVKKLNEMLIKQRNK